MRSREGRPRLKESTSIILLTLLGINVALMSLLRIGSGRIIPLCELPAGLGTASQAAARTVRGELNPAANGLGRSRRGLIVEDTDGEEWPGSCRHWPLA